MQQGTPEADLDTLKATLEEVRRERDRLRNAPAWAARQLGPLPAVAGISVGIAAAFSGHLHVGWLIATLVALLTMIVVSILYSRIQPYREMRASREIVWREELENSHPVIAAEARNRRLRVEDLLPSIEWYDAMIGLERDLYGTLDRTDKRSRLPRRQATDLQEAFDRERTGLFAVQLLFLLVVALLLLANVNWLA